MGAADAMARHIGLPRPHAGEDPKGIEAKARQGELPPPPDFSAPTPARFRAKLVS